MKFFLDGDESTEQEKELVFSLEVDEFDGDLHLLVQERGKYDRPWHVAHISSVSGQMHLCPGLPTQLGLARGADGSILISE